MRFRLLLVDCGDYLATQLSSELTDTTLLVQSEFADRSAGVIVYHRIDQTVTGVVSNDC